MSPKITRVVDSLVVGLDQQGVGVKSTVVDRIGRDSTWSYVSRGPVSNEARGVERITPGNVSASGFEDVVRSLPDVHRQLGPDVPGQAEMVIVWVRDHHSEKVFVEGIQR